MNMISFNLLIGIYAIMSELFHERLLLASEMDCKHQELHLTNKLNMDLLKYIYYLRTKPGRFPGLLIAGADGDEPLGGRLQFMLFRRCLRFLHVFHQ